MYSSQIFRKPGSVLADHLSSHGIATMIKRITLMDWREPRFESISITLQQAGFTSWQRHRCRLRALTSLVSPLLLAERFRFCGTFPRVAPGCR